MNTKSSSLVSLFLRIGLIFVFAWAAIFMSLDPKAYIHYMPIFVENIMPRETALHLFAIYEIALCIWFTTGKKTFYSGMLSAITIGGLTIVNISEINTLFRNVAIFFSALALAFTDKK